MWLEPFVSIFISSEVNTFFFFFLNVTAGEREKRGLQNLSASNQLKEQDYQTVGEKQYFKLSLNYGDKLSKGGGHRTDQRLPLHTHTHTQRCSHAFLFLAIKEKKINNNKKIIINSEGRPLLKGERVNRFLNITSAG